MSLLSIDILVFPQFQRVGAVVSSEAVMFSLLLATFRHGAKTKELRKETNNVVEHASANDQ